MCGCMMPNRHFLVKHVTLVSCSWCCMLTLGEVDRVWMLTISHIDASSNLPFVMWALCVGRIGYVCMCVIGNEQVHL